MRSLFIYYSHSGNTAYVTDRFKDAFAKLGKTDIFEIDYLHSKPTILRRFFAQFFPFLVRIIPIKVDLKSYDILFLGIPVMDNRPSAVLIKYMQLLKHITGKKIICCYVYGVETSAKKCAKFTERLLTSKGNHQISHVYASYCDIYNEDFLIELIADTLSRIK